ncbi:hypothetical protein [Massilia sp.]|uniref:hypothetical protein n=1 Tax=Massilia sp. TaxID=1882437 RepID=UPI00352BF14B
MAGNILSKEAASLATIGTTGATLATGSAVLVGQLDARAGGALADLFIALFSLTAQWTTITGIAAGTTVADLYLVPIIDGTSSPDVDLTVGASYIPYTMRAGSFAAAKTPTANTNALFASLPVDLFPTLYNVYILNRSGQTISTGAVLKAMGAAAQYT